MKILVISDTHSNISVLKKILDKHTDIKDVFFLGDKVADIDAVKDNYKEKIFHIVSGNCDGFSFYKNTDISIINGVKILFTHGHNFFVKNTTELLAKAARKRNCSLALFGHTHTAYSVYENGLYLVNPGSAAFSRNGKNSYAVIDVLKEGIVPNIIETD